MLSEDLRSLHCWWTKVLNGSAEFTAEGACQFARQLKAAEEQAEALEQAAVDEPFRLVGGYAGGNVVRFPVAPRPIPPGGTA